MKKILSFIIASLLLVSAAQAYTIKKGDTLFGIFGNNWRQVAQENGIPDPTKLKIGTVINDNKKLGFAVVTDYSTTLTASVTSNQNTLPVASVKTKDGTTLSTSTLGAKIFLNVEPGSSREELVVCTDISGSIFTGCTRGLQFSGSSEAASTTLQKAHNAGSTVIMSNVHYVYNQYVTVADNQTITGIKTFSQIPLIPTSTPTDPKQVVSLGYLQTVTSSGGGVNMSEILKGVGQIGTQADVAAGTSVGSTGARLLIPASMASTTGGSGTTTVVITNSSGYISSTFGGVTSSLATLNSSSLVVQNPANATLVPAANKIPIASSTNGKLDDWITPILPTFGQTTRAYNAGTGTTTITHALGRVPRLIKITAFRSPYQDCGGSGCASFAQSVGAATSTSGQSDTYYETNINSSGSTLGGPPYFNQSSSSIINIFSSTSGTMSVAGNLTAMDTSTFSVHFSTFDVGYGAGSTLYLQWEAF